MIGVWFLCWALVYSFSSGVRCRAFVIFGWCGVFSGGRMVLGVGRWVLRDGARVMGIGRLWSLFFLIFRCVFFSLGVCFLALMFGVRC